MARVGATLFGDLADYLADYLATFHDDFPFVNIEKWLFLKDIGFEPIQWKYECQGLHLSESNYSVEIKWVLIRLYFGCKTHI